MDTVPDIIEQLGGATAISNETGIPLTTVHSWKRAKFVPRWRVGTLVALAEKLGKPITEASFPNCRPGVPVCATCDRSDTDACTSVDCPMRAAEELKAA